MIAEVIYSKRALNQLASIQRYITRKNSPKVAASYIQAILDRCERLALAPTQGSRHDDLKPGVRVCGFKRRVTIIFRLTADKVQILSVTYAGKQDGLYLTPRTTPEELG